MVMYQVMKQSDLYDIRDKLKIIEPEIFDQFFVGVLSWYHRSVEKPSTGFYGVIPSIDPPNLFHLIEYPNLDAEYVIRLFVDSRAIKLQKLKSHSRKDSLSCSVKEYNEHRGDLYESMLHDVQLVLNGYHLFHCYQDDVNINALYFNPYVKEVW